MLFLKVQELALLHGLLPLQLSLRRRLCRRCRCLLCVCCVCVCVCVCVSEHELSLHRRLCRRRRCLLCVYVCQYVS